MSIPIEFPAAVGCYPQIVMVEHIETIERDSYYDNQCVLVLNSGRRISVGCSPARAAQMIRGASATGA
jgi:hypothetical protein